MSNTPETDAAMLLEREGITHPELHETYMAWTDYWALGQHARSLERRLQEAQRQHGETLVEYELEMSELRKLLTHGVAQIRAWHGMNLPEDQEPALWEIYWNNAPELKALRAALSEKGKP